MRQTDISKYTKTKGASSGKAVAKGSATFLSVLWKFISTIFMVFIVSGIVVAVSMIMYCFSLANEPTGINLNNLMVPLTSFVYAEDKDGNTKEYFPLKSSENRISVKFEDIPKNMTNAMIAIEDKRFYEHNGVDLRRTGGAILSLATGSDDYGGSTITQQLIKNVTKDKEVSINRKLREIFRALNLEKEYTKEAILEAYLNVVNFGSGCNGVQAAANLYFNKDIKDCSIAECAAIAGITQNPAAYTPIVYPEYNKERRETVIDEMYDQKMITKEEYEDAMKESEDLEVVGYIMVDEEEENKEEESSDNPSWYIDTLFRQVREDLARENNYSFANAEEEIYTGGLKIYAAVDLEMQEYAENYAKSFTSNDKDLQMAFTMMGFDGRIIATVGGRNEHDGMLLYDRATYPEVAQQPGSTIKPAFSYPMAIEKNILNFSSTVTDEYIENYYPNGDPGPNNFDNKLHGSMTVANAIEMSINTIPAALIKEMGAINAFNQATSKMGFKHLAGEDAENYGALSIGGMNGGTTPTEMAGAYMYMGNGGKYYPFYTYYYVEDANGDVILDNRENIPTEAYTTETATIMNRLLHHNVQNSVTTQAGSSKISGWDIIGKTGSTDLYKDVWFTGLSPYATLSIWTGFDTPAPILGSDTNIAVYAFQDLMSHYLENKEAKEFTLTDTVVEMQFCASTGLIATEGCPVTHAGYYKEDNQPTGYCYHTFWSSGNNSSGGSSSSTGGQDTPNTTTTEPPNDTTPSNTDETPTDEIPTDDPPADTVPTDNPDITSPTE